MTVNFPKLTAWQESVYKSMMDSDPRDRVFVIKSPRQRGKSFFISVISLAYAITHPDTETMIVSPTNKQCKKLFREIRKAANPLTAKVLETTNELWLNNGSHIFLASAEQREALRGFTVTGILLIDEAAYIQNSIYEILIPTTTKHKAPILLCSSPAFAQGFFFDMYQRGINPSDAKVFSFDWSDTAKYDFRGFITEEQIEFYRKIYSPQKFRSEVEGEFISDQSFCFGNFLECVFDTPSISDQTIVAAGIDWGTGSNGDFTEINFMNAKGESVRMWSNNTLSPTKQVEEISAILNAIPALKVVLVESNSIGSVYADMLRNNLRNKAILQLFTTTNESKCEIIESLIKAFGLHTISILPDPDLKLQLEMYQMEPTSTGKHTYNAAAGFHDDKIIALALAYRAVRTLSCPPVGTFHYTSRNKKHKRR